MSALNQQSVYRLRTTAISRSRKTEVGKPPQGFTLVELLVVITIIAILSVIGITIFSGVQKSARDAKRRGDMNAIAKALEIYKSQNNTYNPQTIFNGSCNSPFDHPFNAWNFGIVSQRSGCDASLQSAWVGLFAANGIPQDPNCTGKSCPPNEVNHNSDGAGLGTDYWLSTDANSFVLSAKLEGMPAGTGLGCHTGYNYCLKNQQ